jgi:lipopolysaccharide export system permease protein
MLFHSSIRKELARSFGATLVVMITVVVTMTLIRTLGEAGRGVFNPSDVMIIMGYTVLSDMPTILSMCLFLAILSVLTRMFRDSEMVIWFGSGRGLTSLVKPLFRFAWPILLVITALALLILPWAYSRIEDMRDRYEKRGDIARIEPGQFQESANGERVFFIEKDASGSLAGSNVFIAQHKNDKDSVTSARSGHVEVINNEKFLILENGQRLETTAGKPDLNVGSFKTYGAQVDADDQSARSFIPSAAKSTLELLNNPTKAHLAEISWRVGLALAAVNLVVIGLATAGVNPRVGRTANLGFAFMVFVVYFNLLILGKNWIETGQTEIGVFLPALHGGALILALLWLARRHNNWAFRFGLRPKAAILSSKDKA